MPKEEGRPPDTKLYGSKLFHWAWLTASLPVKSIGFNQWGGESDRESVSWPEDTIAGSIAVKSVAVELFQPARNGK